jgi:hypothetical protein
VAYCYNTSNVEKLLEGLVPNIFANCSKIVVEIDPLVEIDPVFVGRLLNHEKEISFISVEAVHFSIQDTSSSSGMDFPIV